MVKIETTKNKITVGKQSIELTLQEMKELRDKLDEVLGRQSVVVYPPYKPIIIEDGPLNPKPWDIPKYPKYIESDIWCRQPGEVSNVKVEM